MLLFLKEKKFSKMKKNKHYSVLSIPHSSPTAHLDNKVFDTYLTMADKNVNPKENKDIEELVQISQHEWGK